MALLRRPSAVVVVGRPQFQKSSPPKPFDQSKQNFMWSIFRKYINGPGHMTKMNAMPIYGKNHKKSSSLEPVDKFQ